jgi:glycosyltransferase involved in cell wall biosynthesis
MAHKKRIVLLTTGQPASNPRLVKEADALAHAGYAVQVRYCYWAQWAQEVDNIQLPQAGWTGRLCGGSPQDQARRYCYTRLRRKTAALLPAYLPAIRRTFCRAYDELLAAAIESKADLYIAHNLGALPVAAEAARRNCSLYAFDAEDYHRGEALRQGSQFKKICKIEDLYISNAAYVTSSSPLIAEKYKAHYPDKRIHVIHNVFPIAYHATPKYVEIDKTADLKIFWFSQTTGFNRGLQDVLQAMNQLEDFNITCTIMGNTDRIMRRALNQLLSNKMHAIRFIESGSMHSIFEEAAKHHLGLALEPAFSVNNNLALSNKIFTYLLSGLGVIASETAAQSKFMRENPAIGRGYPIGDFKELSRILTLFWKNPDRLYEARNSAIKLALEKYNWDLEQHKFLQIIQSVL